MQELIPFAKKKRDEMTFGYLPDHVLPDLVPDMTGSAQFYTTDEISNLMQKMDSGFVGMRRSTIDKTNAVRQIILYTTPVKKNADGVDVFAVYQRSKGSEAKLEGGYSFGLGGHVEMEDVGHHVNVTENGYEHFPDCPSSFISTLNSGVREVGEEVRFSLPNGESRRMTDNEMGAVINKTLDVTSISAYAAQEPLENLKDVAVFSNENYVIIRGGDTPDKGLLIYKVMPTLEQIYVHVTGNEPITNVSQAEARLNAIGFLSDIKPDQPEFIGNTHIAVLAVVTLNEDFDFEIAEENYTTIGWMTADEMRAVPERFEPWSRILLDHLETIGARADEARITPMAK